MIIARKNGTLIVAKVLREAEKSTLCAVYDGKHVRVRNDDPKQKLFDNVDAALQWIGTDLTKLKELAERADALHGTPSLEHVFAITKFREALEPKAILGLIADLEDARNGMEYQPIMQLKNKIDRLKAENEALKDALKPFAEYERVRAVMGGNAPRTGTLFECNTKAGDAEITVEDMKAAQAALEGGGR